MILALCQRYYCVFNSSAGAAYPTASNAVAQSAFYFPVTMRANPSIVNGTLNNGNISSDSFTVLNSTGGYYQITQGAAAGNFTAYRTNNSASAEL